MGSLFNKKAGLTDDIRRFSREAIQCQNPIIKKQYEKQIEELATELEEIEQNLSTEFDYTIPYRTSQKEVLDVFQNPYAVWKNYNVHQKQRFFQFIFESNLVYDRKLGCRTPEYSLPIRLFEAIENAKPNEVEVVRPYANQIIEEFEKLIAIVEFDTNLKNLLNQPNLATQ